MAVDAQMLARIERVCVTSADPVELRSRVIDLLRPSLRFDAHVWVLTDPVTGVGCAPYAEVPRGLSLPALIKGRYLTPGLRGTGEGAWRLDRLPLTDPWRSRLAEYGVTDVVSVQHQDVHGSWAFFDLWRLGGVFEPAEVGLVEGTAPTLTAAIRTLVARSLAPVGKVDQGNAAVLVLDDGLQVVGGTATAQAWLERLLPPSGGRPAVPALAYNVAAQLLAREAGIDQRDASARTHLGGGSWLRVRAARITASSGRAQIAVTMDVLAGLDRLDLYIRAHGITPREADVVRALAEGEDTATVATRLHISEYTVQDHLKSVFRRTGTSSRRELLAAALGSRAAVPG